jgi:hypothetical protein
LVAQDSRPQTMLTLGEFFTSTCTAFKSFAEQR